MILNNCVSVISTIATKENPKLIESIFPGLFTFIAKVRKIARIFRKYQNISIYQNQYFLAEIFKNR